MKVTIENLGPLRKAEYEVGDLTLICGENNTGKTYATYALYGFLDFWHREVGIMFGLNYEDEIKELRKNRSLVLNIPVSSQVHGWKLDLREVVEHACRLYYGEKELSHVFGTGKRAFSKTRFYISGVPNTSIPSTEFEGKDVFSRTEGIKFTLRYDADTSTIHFTPNENSFNSLNDLQRGVNDLLLRWMFPRPFIVSVERTGAAIFQSELDINQIALLNAIKSDKNIGRIFLTDEYKPEYRSAIEHNIAIIRSLKEIYKRDSYITDEHPDLLNSFKEILGGDFTINELGLLKYVPQNSPTTALDLNDTSSSVCSLLLLDFYLRHIAKKGDILMIDEPELSLHPENQRRMARLFAWLVNIGIKVMVTTHSDYIVKELNTLIILHQKKPYLRMIQKRENISDKELLSPNSVKVYVAQREDPGGITFIPAKIYPQFGIHVTSFDENIIEMNKLREEILNGGD